MTRSPRAPAAGQAPDPGGSVLLATDGRSTTSGSRRRPTTDLEQYELLIAALRGRALTSGSPEGRSLAGSTVIITGASSGIGRSAARAIGLPRRPARSWSGDHLRSIGPSRPNSNELRRRSSIGRSGARGTLSSVAAGRPCDRRPQPGDGHERAHPHQQRRHRREARRHRDGFELAFGVNYVAHYLLTSLLLEAVLPITTGDQRDLECALLDAEARPRSGHRQDPKPVGMEGVFAHSKAALAALSVELAERYAPGRLSGRPSRGGGDRSLASDSPAVPGSGYPSDGSTGGRGRCPLVRAATDPGLRSGAYLAPGGPANPGPGRAATRPPRRRFGTRAGRWVEPFR